MRLLKLKTSTLSLVFAAITVSIHLASSYLLRSAAGHATFAIIWQNSLAIYWPAMVLVQFFGSLANGSPWMALILMFTAAFLEWWIIFCTGIWLVRLYFRKPSITKATKIGIPITVLIVAVVCFEGCPGLPGMGKYDRFRMEVGAGHLENLRKALKHNPEFATKVRKGWGTALHEAAQMNRAEIAELLLQNGAEANGVGINGYSPLHLAARSGCDDVIKVLLAHKANVNAADQDGNTPLWHAAAGGHTNTIVLLLANGADVNARDRHGNCPLSGAIMNNRYGVVPLLLSHGANPIVKDLNGESMLDRAALQGSPALAESLLPYFNGTNSAKYLSKAFSAAFQFGHMDVAIPISVSALRFESNSVFEAAFNGNADETLTDIASQPDLLNAKDFLGLTPLHRAAQAGQGAVVKLLLAKGATVDSTDQNGNTPLHWAVFTGHSNIVEMLIQNRASLNAKGAGEKSALHLAVQQGFLSLSEMLLKAGANPNIATQYGEMPLCIAVAAGDVEAVKLLLAYQANFNVKRYGDSLFHIWAEGSANLEVAHLLLANGCDVNVKGREGNRPLHALLERSRFQADQKGQLEAVNWLLAHNVDVNARNDKGQTPLSLLKWKNRGRTIERRKDIGDLLRSHGATE